MIVLDTHVLLWRALEPARVSAAADAAIAADRDRVISAITVQEVAYLVARGRVDLYRPVPVWIGDALAALRARALPVTSEIALSAGSLDPAEFHGDPVDRLVYATALVADAKLVTADRRLLEADPARTVW